MDSIGKNFAVPGSSRRAAARAPRGAGLRRLAIGLNAVALAVRLCVFLVVLLFATTLASGLMPPGVLRAFLFLYVAPPALALVALAGAPRWWWTVSALALNALDALSGLALLVVVPLMAGWIIAKGQMSGVAVIVYAVFLLFASVCPLATVVSLWRRL